jgi:TrmH family RNA methyltransferase
MIITSPDNPILKKIRKAVASGRLTDDGLAVAEGPHLVAEAVRSGLEIERIVVSEEAAFDGFVGHTITTVSSRIFRELKNTEHSQGVLALVRAPIHNLEEICKGDTPGLVVVLDGIQDPGNAGTIIRSAEAFGVTGVVLLKGSVHPWNPKCLRASAGSLFRIPVASGVEDLSVFGESRWYVAAGEALETIDVVDWTRPSLLFVGNEGAGVGENWRARSQAIRIPTIGVESLNAAVAASVILYEAHRQRSL